MEWACESVHHEDTRNGLVTLVGYSLDNNREERHVCLVENQEKRREETRGETRREERRGEKRRVETRRDERRKEESRNQKRLETVGLLVINCWTGLLVINCWTNSPVQQL